MSDNSSESRGLRGTVVVIQHATYPLAAADTSLAIRSPERLNQLVPDALMTPFEMVVGHEFGDGVSKVTKASSGYRVEPATWTRRDCNSMMNIV
jgi:hypothetical protein